MKPTLFVMVGAPGSGKSYFAHQLLNWMDNVVYISRDEVRMSIVKDDEHYFSHETRVYRIFIKKIATWLRAGHDVIADATHLNVPSRRKLVNHLLIKQGITTDEYNIVFIVMHTPLATCIERDSKREGRAHVTDKVIIDFYKNFVNPKKDEFPNVIGVWKIDE